MLAAAIDIRRWLEADRAVPFAERLQRDHAIGVGLGHLPDLERVLAWWSIVAPRAQASLGARVVRLRVLCSVALSAVGLAVGTGIAGVAFTYEGHHPVNLFPLLGVVVGFPLVMLLLTVLLLPGYLPGLGGLQAVLAGMSPARWLGAWLDRYLGTTLFAHGFHGRGQTSTFAKWQLVVFSQWLALGFFAGVLLLAVLLVAFTDLAFGWSTTLEIRPARIHGWLETLAWPWAAWLPEAVPNLSLVEISRFYRLQRTELPREAVAVLGAWWPFVLATVVVYGFLPRLVLLLFAQWRLDAATRGLVVENPDVTALLDRLGAPVVETGALDVMEAAAQSAQEAPAPPDMQGGQADLLIWNGAVSVAEAEQWLSSSLNVFVASAVEVSVLQSTADRQACLSRLSRKAQRLALFTKGWEPPLLEFSDFLLELRSAVGAATSITVVPIDVSGKRVNAVDRQVWAGALARLADPRLYVTEAMA